MRAAFPCLLAPLLAGCGGQHAEPGTPLAGGGRAVAYLRSAGGLAVGRAVASEVVGGLRITIDARAMPPGHHGARLDGAGRCDAAGPPTPAFAAAPHAGTLPTLLIGPDGRGTLGVLLPGETLAGLLDADGAALVVTALPDDPITGPDGARLACGAFQPAGGAP